MPLDGFEPLFDAFTTLSQVVIDTPEELGKLLVIAAELIVALASLDSRRRCRGGNGFEGVHSSSNVAHLWLDTTSYNKYILSTTALLTLSVPLRGLIASLLFFQIFDKRFLHYGIFLHASVTYVAFKTLCFLVL